MHKLSDQLPKLIMVENTSLSPPSFQCRFLLKVNEGDQALCQCYLCVAGCILDGFSFFFFSRCVPGEVEHVFFSLLTMLDSHSYIICHAWHLVIWPQHSRQCRPLELNENGTREEEYFFKLLFFFVNHTVFHICMYQNVSCSTCMCLYQTTISSSDRTKASMCILKCTCILWLYNACIIVKL